MNFNDIFNQVMVAIKNNKMFNISWEIFKDVTMNVLFSA